MNPPFCSRTTQLKSHLCFALLVFPLNPETAVWSSDKLLVNKRYCNMCIDVPESTTAKCGPGDTKSAKKNLAGAHRDMTY